MMLRLLATTLILTLSQPALSNPVMAADSLLNITDVSEQDGFSLWVTPDHSLPLISIEFSIDGQGARNEPDSAIGVTQLLSNTLDEGAGDWDSKAFQAAMADNSISLSFWSSRDDFGGSLYTLSANKDLAFDLLDAALNKPHFEEEAVKRMIAANITRLRNDSSNPEWMAARLTNATLFAGHPYARNSGGTLSSLAKLSAKDLKTRHASILLRRDFNIAVTGDITPTEARKRFQHITRQWQKDEVVSKLPEITLPDKGKTLLFNHDIPQTMVEIKLAGISHTDPDYAAAVVMNYIFGGGGFGSRLTDLIREKHGLTYGISSSLDEMDKVRLLSISTSTKNESVADVLRYIKDCMEDLRNKPVSAAELSDAKSYLTGSMPLSMTSLRSTAKLMNSLQNDGLPVDYLDTYLSDISRVSADDVQRVAKRLLTPENMQVVLVGKPKGVRAEKVDTIPGITE